MYTQLTPSWSTARGLSVTTKPMGSVSLMVTRIGVSCCQRGLFSFLCIVTSTVAVDVPPGYRSSYACTRTWETDSRDSHFRFNGCINQGCQFRVQMFLDKNLLGLGLQITTKCLGYLLAKNLFVHRRISDCLNHMGTDLVGKCAICCQVVSHFYLSSRFFYLEEIWCGEISDDRVADTTLETMWFKITSGLHTQLSFSLKANCTRAIMHGPPCKLFELLLHTQHNPAVKDGSSAT